MRDCVTNVKVVFHQSVTDWNICEPRWKCEIIQSGHHLLITLQNLTASHYHTSWRLTMSSPRTGILFLIRFNSEQDQDVYD